MYGDNPFNVTKAVDLSNSEIETYWVDIPGGPGFSGLLKPCSSMPMFVLGGKGCGKTHLLRYFSYPLQKLRHLGRVASGIAEEGYLGIYLRCSGLNASRFAEKGQPPQVWVDIFAYYLDLWIAQILLGTAADEFLGTGELTEVTAASEGICSDVAALFDIPPSPAPGNFPDLFSSLQRLQREVDVAVNNCALTRKLDVRITATGGRLLFGIPRVLTRRLTALGQIRVLYLLDEFENLTKPQQMYVNTLIREREDPSSFKVGARLYGVKTYGTYSGEEDNKEGSEYEALLLDAQLRARRQYSDFARALCLKRLRAGGYLEGGVGSSREGRELDALFETYPYTNLGEAETAQIVEKYVGKERPYMAALRAKLAGHFSQPTSRKAEDAVHDMVTSLCCEPYPLMEKANLFLLYRAWRSGKRLVGAARAIAEDCRKYIEGPSRGTMHARVLKHFRADLLAQLLRECDMKQRYLGMDTFICMSHGLPRNLLIILKLIFRWAVFNGEKPFEEGRISIRAQHAGVREASEWFFHDARATGPDGSRIRESVERLATFFRDLRFSDKPTECSLCTFSVDLSQISGEAHRMLDLAENWSLLVSIPGGQRDRNTARVDTKYQLNPMLAPRWDLPIFRRGAIALSGDEVTAIFDKGHSSEFAGVVRQRVEGMTAPHFGKSHRRGAEHEGNHPQFPGFGND